MLNLATIDDSKDVATKEYVDEKGLPAVSSADNGKYLAVDQQTWVATTPPGMIILSYGTSTWADFLQAYNANRVIYCRASSNSNPATGVQGRMAFMAYVGFSGSTPTSVEFQYYRSVNTHSISQQGDQMYIYKLDSSSKWTVTVRESYTKIVAGTGLGESYSSSTLTLTNTLTGVPSGGSVGQVLSKVSGTNYDIEWSTVSGTLPAVTSADNGKFLRVVNGFWSAAELPSANGVSF